VSADALHLVCLCLFAPPCPPQKGRGTGRVIRGVSLASVLKRRVGQSGRQECNDCCPESQGRGRVWGAERSGATCARQRPTPYAMCLLPRASDIEALTAARCGLLAMRARADCGRTIGSLCLPAPPPKNKKRPISPRMLRQKNRPDTKRESCTSGAAPHAGREGKGLNNHGGRRRGFRGWRRECGIGLKWRLIGGRPHGAAGGRRRSSPIDARGVVGCRSPERTCH
jgi:hypothetical protein